MSADKPSPYKPGMFPAPLSPQELREVLAEVELRQPAPVGEDTSAFVSRVAEIQRTEIERGGSWHYESRSATSWTVLLFFAALGLGYLVAAYFTLHGLGVL